MRFLLDAGVPHSIQELLQSHDHDVIRLVEVGLMSADDKTVFACLGLNSFLEDHVDLGAEPPSNRGVSFMCQVFVVSHMPVNKTGWSDFYNTIGDGLDKLVIMGGK